MTDSDCVLIAGAGPVGMTTALALSKAGIPVKMFDALAEIPADHRASTLHPSTLMLVEELDMTPELLRQGIESPLFQWRDRTTDRIVAEFDYRDISDVLTYPYALQLEQHKTIEITRDAALAFDCFELHRERKLTDLSQDEDGVDISGKAPEEDRPRRPP